MRVTIRDLEGIVGIINRETGNNEKPYSKDDNGIFKANIGNYHLDGAYGGYSLCQITTEGGGTRDIFRAGHMPKKELYGLMRAFLEGIERR